VALAIAVVIVLSVSDPGTDRQRAERHDVQTVRQGAERLTYSTLADAWAQARLGATAGLTAIVEAIDVRYLSTYQNGDAIIVTFQSRSGACITLIAVPEATRSRPPAA